MRAERGFSNDGSRAAAVLGPGFLPEVVAGPCLSSACSAALPPVPTKREKKQVLSLGQGGGGYSFLQ